MKVIKEREAYLSKATNFRAPELALELKPGTGKTETMLALNTHQRFERLLVVVPTDAIREQIARTRGTTPPLHRIGHLSEQPCGKILHQRIRLF
ncbi:hypothetical protein D3227_33425 [Mesorhizobium waimense]|uniref:Helicase/UvrB N-terminal domain-containing protein n=1 Tax=Mesorhizobium waimense TaxID=1300307 RepID=A0A3A5K0S5_9HYPH|nr:DEAD/DEAH box helicase family protein [Mesorhizobium waimense]RJT28905.1 hypothetical protein D3227_33425 [Mesorhizobium waimense]